MSNAPKLSRVLQGKIGRYEDDGTRLRYLTYIAIYSFRECYSHDPATRRRPHCHLPCHQRQHVLYFHVAEDPFHGTRKFINLHPQAPQSNATSPIDAFDFLPLDSEAIRSICADTEWDPALVFTCSESVGGIGNIRNSILNCVRFAISAGAALVEPAIVLRNDADSTEIRTSVKTDMGYMLDPAHFRESLRISCPGKKVYDRIEDLKGKLFHDQIALLPESLEEKVPSTGLAAQRSGGNLLTPGSASTSGLHQREP